MSVTYSTIYRVHKSDLGGTAPCLCLGCAVLEGGEAGSPRESDVAGVGRGGGGHALVDDQRALPQLGPCLALLLPELLQLLHNVNCEKHHNM